MPSSRSCSCASSSRASASASATTLFSSRARSTSAGPLVGRRRPHRGGRPLGLRAGLVAAVDRGVAGGEQLLQRGEVERVAAPGEPPHGVGGGVEQDARVVHRSRLSPGRQRVSGAVTPHGPVRRRTTRVRKRATRGAGTGRSEVVPARGAEAGCALRHSPDEESPCPRSPVVRLRNRRRPAARRHDRRRPRPHRRPPSRRRGPRRGGDRAPLDLRGVRRPGRRAGSRAARRGCADRGPGGDLGAERRGVGVRPVRDGQDRRDPGQHQPRLPHARAGVRAQPVRRRGARRRAQLQDLRLRRDDRGGPAPLPRPAAGGAARLAEWDALAAAEPATAPSWRGCRRR